ncbi:3'-5' exonuclease [Actinomadura macrotermitis]|uniref:DNA polymerase III PolC-type n=1 Tax=Actinomadura macrotermitis TaxID=2585200 RepID=A0A7K0BTV2_9ACTN|nr:3'-5' exonuclease [Actinomadura macrotermitis]MQY04567.1 DNA polymerase III PolC-type [Actinomadura macrotermitis]
MSHDALFSLDGDAFPGAVYAVVDCETNGFSPAKGDAMIELAIVLLDAGGDVVAEWESLLDSGGAVGADWVHGITAGMLAHAPGFAEVAGEIGRHLDRRVVVAHNAEFDLRFLRAAAARLGGGWAPESLCTQQLASGFLPKGVRRLADCCQAAGVPPHNAHAALDDARATAALFQYYLRGAPRPLPWADKVERARQAPSWPPTALPQRPAMPRSRV